MAFLGAIQRYFMLQSGDIDARAIEIDDLVGNGENDQFFKRLIDLTRDFSQRPKLDEALILSGEFRVLEDEKRQDVIDPGDYRRSLRQLLMRGLQLKSGVLDQTGLVT